MGKKQNDTVMLRPQALLGIWYMPIIWVFGRLRHEDCEFEGVLPS